MDTNLTGMENRTWMSMNSDNGSFPNILDYLAIYLPYTILSAIGVLVGMIGNVF